MKDKDIIISCEKILKGKIVRIQDLSIGCDQKVYLIQIDNKKYIYKESKKDISKIKNEEYALNILSNLEIPIPKLIYTDNGFLIESYIDGDLLSKKVSENLFIQLGYYISKIHSVKMEGFGEIKNNKGEYQTESEYLFSWLNLNNSNHKILKNLNLKQIFEENLDLLKSEDSYFLHGDISCSNTIVYDNKINGIIDFGDAICGVIEYDLGLFYIKIKNEKNWNLFLKGYNKEFNEKKFNLYVIAFGIWMIQDGIINENDFHFQKFINTVNKFNIA